MGIPKSDVEQFLSSVSGSSVSSFVNSANKKASQLSKKLGLPVEFVKSEGVASADYTPDGKGSGKVRVFVTDEMAKAKKDEVARQLSRSLSHEARHSKQDKAGEMGKVDYYKTNGKIDDKKYYNNKSEIDALATEVVDDLKDELGDKLKHISPAELKKHVNDSPRLYTISKEGGSSAVSKLAKSVKDVAKDLKERRHNVSLKEGTWAYKEEYKVEAYKKIDELIEWLYDKFGDDTLFDLLGDAKNRIMQIYNEHQKPRTGFQIQEEKVVVVKDDDRLRVQKVGDPDHFVRFPKKLRKKVGQKFDVENLTMGKNDCYTASGEIIKESTKTILNYIKKFVKEEDENSENPLGDLIDLDGEAADIYAAYNQSKTIDDFKQLMPITVDYSDKFITWLYKELEGGAFGESTEYEKIYRRAKCQ
jgi:hypothetical protein